MATFARCIFGPRLYRMHRNGDLRGRNYRPNQLENGSDTVVKMIKFFIGFAQWTSPVSLPVMYRRGWFSVEGLLTIGRLTGGMMVLLMGAAFFRGLGRYTNPDYITFIAVLQAAKRSLTAENRARLARYDFDYWAAPINYSVKAASAGDGSKRKAKVQIPVKKHNRGFLSDITAVPCNIIAYIAAHTFGRRMVYPGTTSMINTLTFNVLLEGRMKLVEKKNGLRAKLQTEDNNEIDTMFVDRRNTPGQENGKYLVICSEGNAGFYEIGCMCTPLDAGYSVLGWNHPGFAQSSGVPFPSQDQNAVDAVMQYALNELGFRPEEIILFAWSIGGYSCTWAAMNYPDVKAVILDATFDHIIPLAQTKMPESLLGMVNHTLKRYLNLNIADQLCRYPGPVLIIRRLRDEIITTTEPNDIWSNRGNDLCVQLLKTRYPKLIDATTIETVRQAVHGGRQVLYTLWAQYEAEEALCSSILASYVEENSCSFPMNIGENMDEKNKIQLSLFLVNKYLEDFDSTHCTPLPVSSFHLPWSHDMQEL